MPAMHVLRNVCILTCGDVLIVNCRAVSGTNVFLGNVACNGIQPCITHCQMCPSTGAPPYNCADGNVVTVTCRE